MELFITRLSILGISGIPRTIGLIQPLLLLLFIISWRVLPSFCSKKLIINTMQKKMPQRLLFMVPAKQADN